MFTTGAISLHPETDEANPHHQTLFIYDKPLFKHSHFGLLLFFKVILKPVWTYGIQLWGTASNSNLEILERFQSKVLRIVTDAPWYVPNATIKRDLQVPTIRQEARKYSANYRIYCILLTSSLMVN